MTLFLTVENRFRRCALLLPARAFSFLLPTTKLPIRHVALDASAEQMPVGSNLSLQAFGKLHDAIAAPLLAAPRASSKSELFRRCRQLLSESSLVLTATDFIPPEVAPPGAPDYFQGYNLAEFGLFGFSGMPL
jgi:hypothetical protein